MKLREIKTIAIVGAGPAGLSAAYKLIKSGIKVDVYDADNQVGGMAKTINLWGQLVDLGPHRFFSKDPRVNNFWLEIVDDEYSMVKRQTRIYYKEKFFDYPLKPFNALKNLGFLESSNCILSFFLAKLIPGKNLSTFEGWVTNRFGSRLFEIFFKSYSEKLWGISCKEIDADFARQRIKKFSLVEAIKSALFGNKTNKHKTLVDQFAYPKHGTGFVYNRIASVIQNHGSKLILNTPIKAIGSGIDNKKPYLKFINGEKKNYDHIISTMPITSLIKGMEAPSNVINHAKSLSFRNTILVYLLIKGTNPFPDQWIYIHSSKLKTGRITNFKNWNCSINNKKSETILCLEYWCYEHDNIWKESNENLISLATNEIIKTKLVKSENVKDGYILRVPKCYPLYKSGYKEHLKPIENFLSKQNGLSVIGRYGAFKYNNQDHSILMGILAAENITKGTNHNLWELNTDYEYQKINQNRSNWFG